MILYLKFLLVQKERSCLLNNYIQPLLNLLDTATPVQKYHTKVRLTFKSVEMAVHWVTLALASGTQCSTGSRELIFLGEETGATWSGLTLSLKVPFRILFEI